MILKPYDAQVTLARLKELLARSPERKAEIKAEIHALQTGTRRERRFAEYIDAELKDSPGWMVIHDLVLDTPQGQVQFDHLIINRMLEIFVLETRKFHTGLKITDHGEFLRWSDDRGRYEGMESPLVRAEWLVHALKSFLADVDFLPKRLGIKIVPDVDYLLLVNPTAVIERPAAFDTDRVVKADLFFKTVNSEKRIRSKGALGMLGQLSQIVGVDTLTDFGKNLVRRHRSGPPAKPVPAPSTVPRASSHQHPQAAQACKKCSSTDLEIRYGKFGYYWKCLACDGNTNPALPEGHKLRKDKEKFFLVAKDGSESLYHVNRHA